LQPITAPFEPPSIQSDCKTVPKRNKKYFLLLYLLPAMTAPRSVSHHLLSSARHLRLTLLSSLYSAFSFPNFSALHLSTYNHSHTLPLAPAIDFPYLVSLLYSLQFFLQEIPLP